MKKLTYLTLNCTIFLLLTITCVLGQDGDTESIINKQITIQKQKASLGEVFFELMTNYDIPIGFEESILDRAHNDFDFATNLPKEKKCFNQKCSKTQEHKRISITIKPLFRVEKHWISINAENSRVEDVLNTIVGQMKNYDWEINNEVVNIFPVKGRDQRFEKLLDLRINKYFVSEGERIAKVRYKILKLPEVIKFLSENNLHSSTIRSDVENTKIKLDSELKFSKLRLKDILNIIIKVKGGGWILKQNKILKMDEKEYIEISI